MEKKTNDGSPSQKPLLNPPLDKAYSLKDSTESLELTHVPHFPRLPNSQAAHIEAIHGHCTILLATLGIVASPLEAVYRLFKSGFPEASSHQEKPVYSPWLAWVRPGLFQWPPWARLLPAVAIWLPMTLCLEADHPDALLIVRVRRCTSACQHLMEEQQGTSNSTRTLHLAPPQSEWHEQQSSERFIFAK